jgi:hypothetical protein
MAKPIYYSKFDQAGIWRVPVNGGTESLVLADKPQAFYWGHWALTEGGIYLLNVDAKPRPTIEFYSFAAHRTSAVLPLEKTPPPGQPSLSASRDGRTIYYSQFDLQSSIKLIENLR